MDSLIDRVIIFCLCMISFYMIDSEYELVQPMLIAIIFTCGIIITDVQSVKSLLIIGYCILAILVPGAFYFFPMFIYEGTKERKLAESIILAGVSLYSIFTQMRINNLVIVSLIALLAVWMEIQNEHKNIYLDKLIETRDKSVELTDALGKRNRALIEKQEYEVYAATLKERNRIAREIHDSVGHVLSRSILQVGALLAVYKDDEIHQKILEIKDSLDGAMDSIRESVHNLHDASIDLEAGIKKSIDGLNGFEIFYHYDIDGEMDNSKRHCILAVVQEAVSNIIKHSNGTKVWININEQPAFYQCVIKDDGTKQGRRNTPGIGLENMKNRVENLHGNINITNDDGFKIFVTIPK